MDGVPEVTQPAVPGGAQFLYDCIPPDPGTYWYHTHGDLQRGRGLYGALIVGDPAASVGYDTEFIVVLSEWLESRTPAEVFSELRGMPSSGSDEKSSSNGTDTGRATASSSTGMSSMGVSAMTSSALGGDAGDVRYPVYLLNGRPPSDPITFAAKPGQRVRIRIINAGDDTAFRVALGGHRMTVTDTDGFPVDSTDTDSLLIGMGERYDVLVTLRDGAFPLIAAAEGKGDRAFAVVRTGSGQTPDHTAAVTELDAMPLTVTNLRATDADVVPTRDPDVTLEAELGGDMAKYVWTVNGQAYPSDTPLAVHPNQRVRLIYRNSTSMFHPMHLHGHTFAVVQPSGVGPRKDTVIVLPGQTITTDFDTVNPGQWILHCHNDFHLAAGMATILSYQE